MKTAVIGLLLAAAILRTAAFAVAADDLAALDTDVKHAETYYQLSTADLDPTVVADGQRWVGEAEKQKDKIGSNAALHLRFVIVKQELDEQSVAAGTSMESVFPLVRFLRSPFFSGNQADTVYTLTGDPSDKAMVSAARQIASRANAVEKGGADLPVVVVFVSTSGPNTTRPDNVAAANERERKVLAEFAAFPELVPHLSIELEARDAGLAAELQAEVRNEPAGPITRTTSDKLAALFGAERVLAVVIRERDVVDDSDANIHSIAAKGYICTHGKDPEASFSATGLTCDRRDRLGGIWAANAALLILACGLYIVIVSTHRMMASETSWGTRVIIPILSFAIGWIVPDIIAPSVGAIHVPTSASALGSLWFPCLMGLGVIGGPLIVYWLASHWLTKLWSSLSLDIRGGAISTAVGIGAAAYLVRPLFLYARWDDAVVDMLLMTAIVAMLAYLLGRCLDRADPLSVSILPAPILLAIPAGLAVLHADKVWLALAAAGVLMGGIVALLWHRRSASRCDKAAIDPVDCRRCPQRAIPADAQELAVRAENPDFQQTQAFAKVTSRLAPLLEGKCCHLGVCGGPGVGKSAVVRAALNSLAMASDQRSREDSLHPLPPIVLQGSCVKPGAERVPFGPFMEALDRQLGGAIFSQTGTVQVEFVQALSSAFKSLFPIPGILSRPGKDGDANGDIQTLVKNRFEALARDRPLILLLDDVQWFDDASEKLLRHLIDSFPAGSDIALAIVLVAGDRDQLRKLQIGGDSVIEAAYPSHEEQLQILVGGIGLREDVAESILARTGAERGTSKGLLWPLAVVARLARDGAFVRTDEGFLWADGQWPADYKTPSNIAAVIEQRLSDASQYRTILECAACAAQGRAFSASLVAAALDKKYLDLLVALDNVSRTVGMISGARDRDDMYEFHSAFIVEQIRTNLGAEPGDINAGTEADAHPKVPQLVREYHGRLGAALEAMAKDCSDSTSAPSITKVFEIAHHYFRAGARYASKGRDFCLEAARTAATTGDLSAARRYLEMAHHCAQWCNNSSAMEKFEHCVLDIEAGFSVPRSPTACPL